MDRTKLKIILTVLYPGIGHIFSHQIIRGIIFVIAYSVGIWLALISLFFLPILMIIVWVWALIDIAKERKVQRKSKFESIVALILSLVIVYFIPFSTFFTYYERTPWEKREVQERFDEYIDAKYNQQSVISKVEFDSNASNMNGTFTSDVYFSDDPATRFSI